MDTCTKLQTKLSTAINELLRLKTKLSTVINNILMLIGIGTIGLLILLLPAKALLYVSAMMITNLPSSISQNASLISILVNAILTISLILVTVKYVVDTHKILAQSKAELRIRLLEKSLESFYIPFQDALENTLNCKSWMVTKEAVNQIGQHRYLGSDTARMSYEDFFLHGSRGDVESILTNLKIDIKKYEAELNSLTKNPFNSK